MAGIVFRTSRAKLLPLAMLIPLMLFFPALILLAGLSVMTNGEEPVTAFNIGMTLGGGLFTILLLLGEVMIVRQLIRPDWLEVTREGVRLKRRGKVLDYAWPQLGEPERKWIATGKSSVCVIDMTVAGASTLRIPAERYVQPLDQVLEALKEARAGRLIPQPPETTPRAYVYGAIPAVAVAVALAFGTIGWMAWDICSRP